MFVGTISASSGAFEKVVGMFRFRGTVLVDMVRFLFQLVSFLIDLGYSFSVLGISFRGISICCRFYFQNYLFIRRFYVISNFSLYNIE